MLSYGRGIQGAIGELNPEFTAEARRHGENLFHLELFAAAWVCPHWHFLHLWRDDGGLCGNYAARPGDASRCSLGAEPAGTPRISRTRTVRSTALCRPLSNVRPGRDRMVRATALGLGTRGHDHCHQHGGRLGPNFLRGTVEGRAGSADCGALVGVYDASSSKEFLPLRRLCLHSGSNNININTKGGGQECPPYSGSIFSSTSFLSSSLMPSS